MTSCNTTIYWLVVLSGVLSAIGIGCIALIYMKRIDRIYDRSQGKKP